LGLTAHHRGTREPACRSPPTIRRVRRRHSVRAGHPGPHREHGAGDPGGDGPPVATAEGIRTAAPTVAAGNVLTLIVASTLRPAADPPPRDVGRPRGCQPCWWRPLALTSIPPGHIPPITPGQVAKVAHRRVGRSIALLEGVRDGDW